MMRTKAMMMVAGTLTAALGASAVTFALFSDSAAQQQAFQAGTVSLYNYRDQGDTVDGPMFYTTPAEGETGGGVDGRFPTGFWAPGDSNLRVLILKNSGDLDVWLTGVTAELAPGSSQYLADKLTYAVALDKAGTQVLAAGNLGELIGQNADFIQKVALNAQPTIPLSRRTPKPLYFTVGLPLKADNSYQTEMLRVDFKLFAEQKRNNP